jgi:hypothetical protein
MSSLKVDVIIAMQKQLAAVTKERDELKETLQSIHELLRHRYGADKSCGCPSCDSARLAAAALQQGDSA